MDYYCMYCAQPIEYVGSKRIGDTLEDDIWEHKDFNSNCGQLPNLATPENIDDQEEIR